MNLSENVGYLLQHLAFTMSRQNDQLLQERLGLSFSRFKILMVLEQSPHIQQRQIADTLGQTEASVSRQIKLMQQEGLLQTVRNPHNRREHLTTLTSKGLRLVEESMAILNRHHGPMFDSLNGREYEHLLSTLQQMHQGVCQAGKTAACSHPFRGNY